ncbi:hypothetical protein NT04LS_1915, partial [Listeria seeligeri FSL S4-171]
IIIAEMEEKTQTKQFGSVFGIIEDVNVKGEISI